MVLPSSLPSKMYTHTCTGTTRPPRVSWQQRSPRSSWVKRRCRTQRIAGGERREGVCLHVKLFSIPALVSK